MEITPYATASDWFVESVRTISRFEHLGPNWDSYNSPPLTRDAKSRALQVLICLDRQLQAAPLLEPVPGGGDQIEWTSGPRALELEVLPNGSIEFLRVYEADRMEEGVIPDDRMDYLREQAAWLTQHPV